MNENDIVDSLIDEDDLEIDTDVVYRFELPDQDFVVEFSTIEQEWSAVHLDEEQWDERVFIDPKEFENSTDILLFDVYNLTKKRFEEMVRTVEADMEESDTNNI